MRYKCRKCGEACNTTPLMRKCLWEKSNEFVLHCEKCFQEKKRFWAILEGIVDLSNPRAACETFCAMLDTGVPHVREINHIAYFANEEPEENEPNWDVEMLFLGFALAEYEDKFWGKA